MWFGYHLKIRRAQEAKEAWIDDMDILNNRIKTIETSLVESEKKLQEV